MSTETDAAALEGLAGLIDTTVVDGIPTLLAAREGPLFAGLVFRVGRGDETLATAGVTHLVEHLALHRLNTSDLHHNGQTAAAYTAFHVTGTSEEVVGFLNGVCAALRDLPLERLETEKEILRVEASRREGGHAFAAMSLWRYGAQGPGLVAYGEEGLPRLTADDVTAWASTRFTRDNAVLFLTAARVPDGLDLALPAGRRIPIELPAETLPHKPAWFCGGSSGVVVDGIVPRSSATQLFARTADRALFRRLRQDAGLSYSVGCEYEPLDAGRARVVAYADALPDKQDAVVHALVDALADLKEGHVDPADVVAARRQLRQETDVPDLGAAMLPNAALNLLAGTAVRHPDELRTERDAVTVEDLTGVARAFWDDALAQVPDGGLDRAGFVPAPTRSETQVVGRAHPHRVEAGAALVLADDGVTLRTRQGFVTVRYEDCVLMTAYADGGRHLVGRDGFAIVVEPTMYGRLSPAVVAAKIDAHVPVDVVVRRPARPAGQIPRPARVSRSLASQILPRWRGLGPWARTTGISLMALNVVLTFLAVLATGGLDQSGYGSAGDVSVFWLVVTLLWWGGVVLVFGAARRRAVEGT